MLDLKIILVSLIGFLVFVLLHIILFRITQGRKIFSLIAVILLIIGLGQLIGIIILLRTYNILDMIMSLASVQILTAILSVNYIMLVFGVATTSVRIELLLLIIKSGKKGLSKKQICGEKNLEKLLDGRLLRLQKNGDIFRKNQTYQANKRLSFFVIYTQFIVFLVRFFGNKDAYQLRPVKKNMNGYK